MANAEKIAFRRLRTEDFPLLHKWLNTPHVRDWWDGEQTMDQVIEKYTPHLDGTEPIQAYIVLTGGRPVGYVQTYMVRDFPHVRLDEAAAGLDIFIGEPDCVERGLGTRILRAALHQVVFSALPAVSCIVDPAPHNARAIRAYEKAGFRYLRTVQVEGWAQPSYLMRIPRLEAPVSPLE